MQRVNGLSCFLTGLLTLTNIVTIAIVSILVSVIKPVKKHDNPLTRHDPTRNYKLMGLPLLGLGH